MRIARSIAALGLAAGVWLGSSPAWCQSAADDEPAAWHPGFAPLPSLPDDSTWYPVLGAAVLGASFGSGTWLAFGALGSEGLRDSMLKPLPIGVALGATAAGATAGALAITDRRRFAKLDTPMAAGVILGSTVAVFGGGAWFLACEDPRGPERDACERRAGRYFAGSLAVGTFAGGAMGLALALAADTSEPARPSSLTLVPHLGGGALRGSF